MLILWWLRCSLCQLFKQLLFLTGNDASAMELVLAWAEHYERLDVCIVPLMIDASQINSHARVDKDLFFSVLLDFRFFSMKLVGTILVFGFPDPTVSNRRLFKQFRIALVAFVIDLWCACPTKLKILHELIVFLSLCHFDSLLDDNTVNLKLMKSVCQLVSYLREKGIFWELFDDLLLVVDIDDILHQFVDLIVIVGGQGNNFVPELMHVG